MADEDNKDPTWKYIILQIVKIALPTCISLLALKFSLNSDTRSEHAVIHATKAVDTAAVADIRAERAEQNAEKNGVLIKNVETKMIGMQPPKE